MTYRIVRMYARRPGKGQTIRKGLSLEEAQRYCSDPETSSSTCTTQEGKRRTQVYGAWFDGYSAEPTRHKEK